MSDEKELLAEIENLSIDSQSLVSQGKALEALKTASIPSRSKDQVTKDLQVNIVCYILGSIKDSEAEKSVNALSEDERTNVMKYLYRGMERGQNCNALLKWHGLLVEKDGVGIIARVLVDTRV